MGGFRYINWFTVTILYHHHDGTGYHSIRFYSGQFKGHRCMHRCKIIGPFSICALSVLVVIVIVVVSVITAFHSNLSNESTSMLFDPLIVLLLLLGLSGTFLILSFLKEHTRSLSYCVDVLHLLLTRDFCTLHCYNCSTR